jgi:hypothetical protein
MVSAGCITVACFMLTCTALDKQQQRLAIMHTSKAAVTVFRVTAGSAFEVLACGTSNSSICDTKPH